MPATQSGIIVKSLFEGFYITPDFGIYKNCIVLHNFFLLIVLIWARPLIPCEYKDAFDIDFSIVLTYP